MQEPLNKLAEMGATDRWLNLRASLGTEGELGRVVRQDRGSVLVATERATGPYRIRPESTGAVVVGDWVVVAGEQVEAVLDRTGLLTRMDARSNEEQAVAANVEVVLIVIGADRPRKPGRLERAIVQSWESNALPIIVLTKSDLLDDVAAELASLHELAPTTDVVAVSSTENKGLEELQERLHQRTSVMVGESGAGKSTLANALVGDQVAATGAVRSSDAKGRHTTTRRELFVLPTGGVLIDTPGVRALGLWADTDAVDATFADISELASDCRFGDCTHETEPGCAVLLAVEQGRIAEARLLSWRGLRKEAVAAELRRDEHERRNAERKSGRLVDEALRAKGKR